MVFCTSSKSSKSLNEVTKLKEIYHDSCVIKLHLSGRDIIQTQVGGKQGKKCQGGGRNMS